MFLPLVLLFSTVASLKLTHVPGKARLSQAPRPIKSQFGISSLLKLTEKNVNNETRDSLLDIIQEAEMENEDALLACGQVTTKLAEAKVSIANAIVANGEEKTKLDEALEANGEAQTANDEVKTKLEERDAAYAAFRAFLANSPLADEKGEHAAIQDRIEAANDAAKADNVREAEELTAAAAAIKESQTKNEEELENLQNDETANTAAIAGNAAEKQKLDETAAAIAKIKEVVNANSDPKAPSSLLNNPSDVGSGVKAYCTSGCDLPCPSGAHGPGWKLPGGSNDEAAELRFDGVELNKEYFTVSMWVNRDDRNNDIGLFSYGEYPNHQGFMLQMRNFPHSYQGDFHIRASSSVSPGFKAYDSGVVGWTDAMVVGKWLHVAIVKDGNTEIRYYRNGEQVGSPNKSFNGSPNTMPANRHFNVGSWFESNKILKGYVSNIHVIAGPNQDSAYTDTQILSLYNAESQQGC